MQQIIAEMSELKGKIVGITGGTGTIGQACVREIINHYSDVKNVVIFSRDELKQLEMMEEYPEDGAISIQYHLGDVRDLDRLKEVMQGVDYLIHAAAIKHVVMAEKNPNECWKTNVKGTLNVVQATITNEIQKSILISTDKAQNPIGIYGKSKSEAEKSFMNVRDSDRFGIVRLGNVIDSRGSVYEAFRKQKATGILKVTHPDATRFCISQERTAQFILASLLSINSATIAIPTMESVRVVDIARKIAPGCEIVYTGLRPGDKLHEELGALNSEDLIASVNSICKWS